MELEIKARRASDNPLLAGLVERYGAVRVFDVVEPTLGFPPEMVTSMPEARKIAEALEAKN